MQGRSREQDDDAVARSAGSAARRASCQSAARPVAGVAVFWGSLDSRVASGIDRFQRVSCPCGGSGSHLHDLPPRARPLPHGPLDRHESLRVFLGVRPEALVGSPRRNRIRRACSAARRLCAHLGHEQLGRHPAPRRAPHLQSQALQKQVAGGRGWFSHAFSSCYRRSVVRLQRNRLFLHHLFG